MTIKEAIEKTNRLRPNSFSHNEKTDWLIDFESRIYNEIYSVHKCDVPFTDLAQITDDTELFAVSPYDEMYLLYLCSMVDFSNAEYDRYNNDMARLADLYGDYERYWNNTSESALSTVIIG